VNERHRKPEPGKSSLTSSAYRDHTHGPGKRTLTEALPLRAPARRSQLLAREPANAATAPEPEKDAASDDAGVDSNERRQE
jgi:hypothetical protein